MTEKDDAQKILDEVKAESRKPTEHTPTHHSKKVEFNFSWKKISIILGVLLIISVAYLLMGGNITGATVSSQEATDKTVDFIERNVQGVSVEVVGTSVENGLYKIELSLVGEQGPQPLLAYVTMDGSLMFPQAIDLTEAPTQPAAQQQAPTPTVTKSDKPVVELFVMSHCPFGTQAEKGLLPVAQLLEDKIDFSIKFVNYAMHGEKEVREQQRQVCIQDEQNDKYFKYLWKFLETDDYEAALKEADIDTAKLETCMEELDKEFDITVKLEDKSSWSGGRFPQFLVHNDENLEYGVQGSPTLVINGAQASSSRDSASYLRTVCAAFNNAPDECDEELSSTSPSSGFGLGEAAAASAATCG